jgi:hypothetical protein
LVWAGKTKDFRLDNSNYSLNLIYFWFHHISCLFVSVVPKYVNFATFTNDLLAILIFWFCPEFGWRDVIQRCITSKRRISQLMITFLCGYAENHSRLLSNSHRWRANLTNTGGSVDNNVVWYFIERVCSYHCWYVTFYHNMATDQKLEVWLVASGSKTKLYSRKC